MESNLNKKINVQMANIQHISQNILPIPINKAPVPNVEKPVYYGKSPYPMEYKVSSRKNDESQYCNTLGQSPRNQLLNVPHESTNCPNHKTQSFKKDSCYVMNNKRQGVMGLVCDQSGNSNNSDSRVIRGNQFGQEYDWNLINDIKKKEYTVEQPIQHPMHQSIVHNNSSFYPTTNFYLSKSKNYDTYPKENNMTETGYPITTRSAEYSSDQIENYMNYDINKNMLNLIIIILTILIVLIIIYFTRR